MKNRTIVKSIIVSAALLPAAAMAQFSANIGWVSEYVFRGLYQFESSASAGFDYESDGAIGFYAGTWGADVGDGMEIDLYAGLGGGGDSFSWSVGVTDYEYTGGFDTGYEEVNLGIGAGIFSLDVAIGSHTGDPGQPDPDYEFVSVTIAPEGWPTFTYGAWGNDFAGEYLELGYSYDFMGVDLSIGLIYGIDLEDAAAEEARGKEFYVGPNPFGDEWQIVFGISKSFDIGS